MELRRERKEAYSSAVVARQLAVWAEEGVNLRETSTPTLAGARQLCAMRGLAERARAVIVEARGSATEFPEDLIAFERKAADVVALAEARLQDVERGLRAQGALRKPCEDHTVTARLEEATPQRLAALKRAVARYPKLARSLLEWARERDPSPEVRAEAARWMSAFDTAGR
jgi:hypothetical protein